MIPGLEPVAEAEEAFTFTQPADTEKPSKYAFADGKYPAKIVNLAKNLSSKGNPQFVVTCLGTGGFAKGIEYKEYVGRPWEASDPGYSPTNAQPNTLWKLSKLLDAVGVAKAPVGQPRNFNKSDVVGKEVTLNLKAEEYNGKTRMKVADLLPPTPVTTTNSEVPAF